MNNQLSIRGMHSQVDREKKDDDEHVPLLGGESPVGMDTSDVPDVVQFFLPVFVVHDSQGTIELPIMRIGNWAEAVSFSYATVEASARAGVQYEHVSGVVSMAPGESGATVSIPIKKSSLWNATLEFKVVLSNPTGCCLGLYLKHARVKVINDTPFPSETFQKSVSRGVEGMASVSKFRLFIAFMWFLGSQDGLRWRTAAMLVIDLLKNAYHYFQLWLSVYLVDDLFNFEKSADHLLIPGSRLATAFVISCLTLAPMLLFFALDHFSAKMDVSGLLQAHMSRNLFRKFMNYSKQSADMTPVTGMVQSLTSDVKEITFGYMNILHWIRLLVEVGLSIFFALRNNPNVWWAALLVPMVMVAWAFFRTSTYIATSDIVNDTDEKCNILINEILTNLDLVTTYHQRPQMNSAFSKRIEGLRVAKASEKHANLTNMFIPKLLGPALVAIYTVIGAKLICEKRLELGIFLATIKILGSMCAAFSDCFGLGMEIIGTLPALKGVFILLNMPTDVHDLGLANDSMVRMTDERRKMLPDHDSVPKADRMDIELADVSFAPSRTGAPVVHNLNFSCSQGKVCKIMGAPGCGRTTVMQLLAQTKYATSGTVFVPSHLRSVYVSDIILMNMSMWDNLVFGNKEGNDPYRVEKLLRHFGMANVERMCQSELEKRKKIFDGKVAETSEEHGEISCSAHHLKVLSETVKFLTQLVRAFIANPEVMVLNRPLMHLHGKEMRHTVEQSFQLHRDHRGLLMPLDSVSLRRPRTIFYSTDTRSSAADWVWEIHTEIGGECKQYAGNKSIKADDKHDALMRHLVETTRANENLSSKLVEAQQYGEAWKQRAIVQSTNDFVHSPLQAQMDLAEPAISTLAVKPIAVIQTGASKWDV